ncbi:MAG: TonB C-terminal domain-containing protein [Polyangiaceae bacterium]|nr:TonB C-terminal domain-containing protein [Polyangiaceae bacterium]
MRSPRAPEIPLFLWVATAVVAHALWGGGADQVASRLEESLDMRRFAASVRREVRRGPESVEVALLEEEDPTPAAVEPAQRTRPEADPAAVPEEQDPERADQASDEETSRRPPVDDTATPPSERTLEPPKPELRVEPPVAPPPAPKPAPTEQRAEPEPPPAQALPRASGRIAVRQHVEKKDQADDPNAPFIADESNRVAEQSQARTTATDQDDPNPTPGGQHTGPDQNPGNADETRVAQSEDRPGEPGRAPDSESESEQRRAARATPPPSEGASGAPAEAREGARGTEGGREGASAGSTAPEQRGQRAQQSREAREEAPAAVTAEGGAASIAPEEAARAATRAKKARRKRLPPARGRGDGALGLLGLGASGRTAGGLSLNLTPRQALSAVGKDALERERRAAAERRRSTHRGSWRAVGLEKWRPAIENYVPMVKPGNQTALNTARVPFASYLNVVHNRLHPIFADSFLASLDGLPGTHPMNEPELSTNLEIILDREDGSVVGMGVTKTSGVTAFDVAALEAVSRAAPFGTPPREIVSPDGRVYFHWEFYRNPYYACSTYFARPFLLKVKPRSAPPKVTPPDEHPREGARPGGRRDRYAATSPR